MGGRGDKELPEAVPSRGKAPEGGAFPYRGREFHIRGKGEGKTAAPLPPRLADATGTSFLDITSRQTHIPTVLVEPLRTRDARRLIREIVRDGSVTFTGHALAEMTKDDLAATDVINMLRGGVVEPAELENGS